LHELIEVLKERERLAVSPQGGAPPPPQGIAADWGNRYLVPSAGLVELQKQENNRGNRAAREQTELRIGEGFAGEIVAAGAVVAGVVMGTSGPETTEGPTTTPEPTTTPLPEYKISFECFPGDSKVLLANGFQRAARDLRPGDVLAVSKDFATVDGEEWVFDPHFGQEETSHEYLDITHEEGVLQLSATHFLFRVPGEFVLAEEIVIGDELYTTSGTGFRSSTVKSVRKVLGQGMYAPVTSSGRLIVDGVLVSSFALPDYAVDAVHEHPRVEWEGLGVVVAAPFRGLCNLWPSACAAALSKPSGARAALHFVGKGIIRFVAAIF
jgi:hypothetical protein